MQSVAQLHPIHVDDHVAVVQGRARRLHDTRVRVHEEQAKRGRAMGQLLCVADHRPLQVGSPRLALLLQEPHRASRQGWHPLGPMGSPAHHQSNHVSHMRLVANRAAQSQTIQGEHRERGAQVPGRRRGLQRELSHRSVGRRSELSHFEQFLAQHDQDSIHKCNQKHLNNPIWRGASTNKKTFV